MKNIFTLCAAAAACSLTWAQDVGRVVSSQAIIQQVAVPRQVCTQQQVQVQSPKSGAGAAMGAIAGGAIGNSVGRGPGNAAATAVGILAGAVLGDKIEGSPAPQVQTVQTCSIQNVYESRTVGYNVVYEFAGKQYSVQLPNDPGPTISLQVTPVGAQTAAPAAAMANAVTPPMYTQSTVVESQVIYQPYYQQPNYPRPYYYPPLFFDVNLGPWGYNGHHHRR